MIDSHAHLEMHRKDMEEVLHECRRKLSAVVDSITEYKKFHVWKSWDVLRPHFGFIVPTLGYHPNEARRGNWDKVNKVERFIVEHRKEIVAIGEIGLDYYYANTEKQRENQRLIFRRFLELADELHLPVVIHARKAEKEAFDTVQKAGIRAYFHGFTGSRGLAREIAENGHMIGVGTGIVFIPEVRIVAESLDIDSILTETDSPYMSPFRGQRNRPTNVEIVIRELTSIKGDDTKEVERITERNAKVFFRL